VQGNGALFCAKHDSFSVECKAFPLLTSSGAYNSNASYVFMLRLSAFTKSHCHCAMQHYSFPVECKAFPLLTSSGAYDSDAIYSHADVRRIVTCR
jgi:hypothetical protein